MLNNILRNTLLLVFCCASFQINQVKAQCPLAGPVYLQSEMAAGANYYNETKNVVDDINNAYDCAHLRRPMIEAAILEHISPQVVAVPIPNWLKADFCNEFPAFCNEIGTKSYFSNKNISYISGSGPADRVDISRIEAKMWVYYLAVTYINHGYTGLHLGDWGQFIIKNLFEL